jgi:hypothetical protein
MRGGGNDPAVAGITSQTKSGYARA